MKYHVFTLLFLTASVTVQAQNDELEDFFSVGLNGEGRNELSEGKISIEDLARERTVVWTAWKRANAAFQEEKLIETGALSPERSGEWCIPDSLEPDARMSYYWGAKGEKPSEGFPVFLYLHGSGPREHEWAAGISLCRAFDDAPSLYFVPRIPNEGAYYRWWQKGKQHIWEKWLRQILLRDDVDADRLYVFGISEGGYGSQRLASFYADYWAAAGPMAGGEPLKNAPADNLRNVAFCLRTGAEDTGFYRNTLTRYVREELDSLSAVWPEDFIHRVELIPGRGHAIDYSPTTVWLKTFRRNMLSKHVTWEDFEMDGLHRRGFHNLVVHERPCDSLRTRYDMRIEGNLIRLQIDDVHYSTVRKDSIWGIEMKFGKAYTPSVHANFTLYLDEHLVDLKKKVTLVVNGRRVYHGRLRCSRRNMARSLSVFYDPRRIYPAAIDVKF